VPGIFCLLITKAYAENTVDVSFSVEMIPAACGYRWIMAALWITVRWSLSSIRSSSPYLLTPRVIGLHIQVREPATGGMDGHDEKAENPVRNLILTLTMIRHLVGIHLTPSLDWVLPQVKNRLVVT
jgi:hypothetical protein